MSTISGGSGTVILSKVLCQEGTGAVWQRCDEHYYGYIRSIYICPSATLDAALSLRKEPIKELIDLQYDVGNMRL